MVHSAACRPQRTLKSPLTFSGVGVHSGKRVTIQLFPSPIHSGIQFQRIDLPGAPTLTASLNSVYDTSRSTNLKEGEALVHTVEHLLAALKAYSIDNLRIEIDSLELPIVDGSALPYVEMIEKVGIQEQEAQKSIHFLQEPLYWSAKQTHLVALPSNELTFSYTLHYPQVPLIRSQYYTFTLSESGFRAEIAPCRTFALYEEVAPLLNQGLLQGGTLNAGVVIDKDRVLNAEGLRFPDEMVRHKILDLIGDLSLMGLDFRAHIIAICSGHFSNVAFGRRVWHDLMAKQSISISCSQQLSYSVCEE